MDSGENGQSSIPQVVYFDANTLLQLSNGESDVDFIELRNTAEKLSVIFYAPEVAIKEWIQKRVEKANKQLDRLTDISRNVGQLLDRAPLNIEKLQDIEKTIIGAVNRIVTNAKINVIATPTDFSLNTLIDMSVKKEAPFEEKKEKGFRDTIILFTIIKHIETKGIRNAFMVSGDRIFKHPDVIDKFNKTGASVLIVENITSAKEKLKEKLDGAVSTFYVNQIQKIREFLDGQFPKISKYIIENASVSELFLRGFLTKEYMSTGTIKQVLGIRPKNIGRIFPDILYSDTKKEKGYEYVTFAVEVEFDLLMVEYDIFDRPKFPLSSPEEYERIKEIPASHCEKVKPITRDISIEARIALVDDRFSELEILRVLTS